MHHHSSPAVTALAEKNMTAHRIASQAAANAAPARAHSARQPGTGWLPAAAAQIADRLADYFTPAALPVQQVLAVAEEAGEFTSAYRRWAGMARRAGTWDEVRDELADVVITAYVTAHVLGIDLDAAARAKTAVIYSRGWREPPPDCA